MLKKDYEIVENPPKPISWDEYAKTSYDEYWNLNMLGMPELWSCREMINLKNNTRNNMINFFISKSPHEVQFFIFNSKSSFCISCKSFPCLH